MNKIVTVILKYKATGEVNPITSDFGDGHNELVCKDVIGLEVPICGCGEKATEWLCKDCADPKNGMITDILEL